MDRNMDLYAELGVTAQAEAEVIRAAYRALARRYHPDLQQAGSVLAMARMARINHAYSVLSQPESRRAYDAGRASLRAARTPPVLHVIQTRTAQRSLQPFLTTYDARGRLHSFV